MKKKISRKIHKKKIKSLNLKNLQNKKLLSNEVGTEASLIAKDKNIRKLVHSFQKIVPINHQKNLMVLA